MATFDDIFTQNELITPYIKYPSSPVYKLIYSVPRKKNLYLSAFTMSRFAKTFIDENISMKDFLSADNDEIRTKTILSALESGHKDVYIQSGLEFYPFSIDLYRDLFVPTPLILNKAAEISADLGENYYGLHIRRTDNQMSIKHSPEKLFHDKIREILAQDSNAKFYLASDDLEVKRRFEDLFGGAIKYQHKQTSRCTLEGIIDAMTELVVLSRSKHIYGSYYSSFSEAAAMMSGVPLTQLFCP